MQANDASQVYLVFDWETRSQVDLKVLGQTEYARDASTEIMCCAFRLGTRVELAKVPTACWSPLLPNWQRSAAYMKFMDALLNPKVMLCAHNAGFEKSICLYVLADRLLREHRLLRSLLEPPQRWVCTAALAAALALPRSLEGAGTSLGLKIQKSMEGRKLLLKMCKPRRISKKNPEGGWHDSLDNLRDLQAYCMTDVDVETDLLLKLPPLNAIERAVWELDQVINTRGVEIDIELVDAVLQMVAVETENLNAETLEITGTVTSTTKIAQLQAWLSDHGCFLPDMTAGTVKDAISSGLAQGDALRLLEIRQQVGKSSVKKYPAFKACGASGRVRDTLMYHAASTGRWGGLRFQLHNLPRPVIKNTNFACEVVKEGDLEMVRLLYGDPINVFSDCLRGVLIAKWGHELYCADFAAIETRVLFWLAGHEDGLQAYRDGRDLYKEMAKGIYSVPVLQVTDIQRQLGKKAILGCFAADTLILTKHGWVFIVDVGLEDQLWDGLEWVQHGGVICQGEKETIDLAGIQVTPDHLFLHQKSWVTASETVKNCTLKLDPVSVISKLRPLKLGFVVAFRSFGLRALVTGLNRIKWTSGTLLAERARAVITAQKKQLRRLSRRSISGTMKMQCQISSTERDFLTALLRPSHGAIPRLLTCINTMGAVASRFMEIGVETGLHFFSIFKRWRAGTTQTLKWTGSITIGGMNPVILDSAVGQITWQIDAPSPSGKTKSGPSNGKCATYDIVDCGPRQRFTVLSAVGPLVAHNCGYGMGHKRFRESCLEDAQSPMDISEELAKRAVQVYRDAHAHVPVFWKNLEKAAFAAIASPGKRYTINKTSWWVGGRFLWCQLPSGRRLAYASPMVRYEIPSWGGTEKRPVLYYWGANATTKQWGVERNWGGGLVENVVQAMARDLMAEAMLRLEAAGYPVVLTVHDEIMAERKKHSGGSLAEFKALMEVVPAWAPGMPIKVSGFVDVRYHK